MVFFPSLRTPGFFNPPKVHRDPRDKEISISFNVFYGSIDGSFTPSRSDRNSNGSQSASITSPALSTFSEIGPQSYHETLHYASFKANVRSDFFSLSSNIEDKPDGTLRPSRGAAQRAVREQKSRRSASQAKEIAFLSAQFNDEILRLWKQTTDHGQCAAPFCTNTAKGLIHQPLCCSSTGYYGLTDGEDARRLMLAVARQAPELDTEAKLRGAIGASGQDAFVNGLALPVCSANGRCMKYIRLCLASFIKTQRTTSSSSVQRYDAKNGTCDYQPTPNTGTFTQGDHAQIAHIISSRRNKSHLSSNHVTRSASVDSIHVRVSVYGAFTAQLRQTIFNLHRYLRGRWDYPSITASLGNDGLPHINDFVVPLCKRNTLCEEVARIAVALFMDRQVPGGLADQVLLPALSCDTHLSQGVNLDVDEDPPKCIVKRLGECRLYDDKETQECNGAESGATLLTVDDLRKCVEDSHNWDDVQRWITDKLGIDIVIAGENDTNTQPQMITTNEVRPTSKRLNTNAGNTMSDGTKRSLSSGVKSTSVAPVKQSQYIDSRTYTYTLETNAIEFPPDGRPTWGGFPLSETSLNLLKAGAHQVKSILPVISLDMARIMEESLLDENGIRETPNKPKGNTLARRSMYVHERYLKKGMDGEKYARRTIPEDTDGDNDNAHS
ncbi:hypothetical protein AAP_05406 [Ascosphaera apis ARSEF 7405]|uniref:Uncharacterized protein n=1 Tax=Ascosphaera apis ARSEF 7405 TaxID=392613 RepID=A0A162IE07_9EURO|nr:hypothetical protein AAP_05406 [Ascosphaera apis ARSEF 7405]